MQRILKKMDAELERLAAVIFGSVPEDKTPPSLALKLFVLGLLVAVLALAWSAR
jgi:hypothetical protein